MRPYVFLFFLLTIINQVALKPTDEYQKEQHTAGSGRLLQEKGSTKINLKCSVTILGAGIAGSHTFYRLAPIYGHNLCIFEQNDYVGGRTYDVNDEDRVPSPYSNDSIVALGASRFFDDQPVIKQLADELDISYYRYDYQTNLIKARGHIYNNYETMCSQSYVNLTCTDDQQGLNPADQLWTRLLDAYHANKLNLYNFADFTAFCRDVLGDEATDYLRDSFRFRGDFEGTNAHGYMEFLEQDWNLVGPIYYPNQGMSEFAKRMVAIGTTKHRSRLFLKQEVHSIDDVVTTDSDHVFTIETSQYRIQAQRLVLAMNPPGWENIQGSVGLAIKSNRHFQAILPVKTVIIECYWPIRWWEESTLYGGNVDRAWTRQNCISFIEITSAHPEERERNLTRTVYDDGLCVDTWIALIERPSQANLIQELTRGLQSIFTDVKIPSPTKIFTKIWPGAWHFQTGNSRFTNNQIARWALKPLNRFSQEQLSLVGEAFYLDRATWTDGAVKSSLLALSSQFNFSPRCYNNDSASGGQFCS